MYHPMDDHADVGVELREIGLMAAVCPDFAETLVRTLLQQSAAADVSGLQATGLPGATTTNGPIDAEALPDVA